MALSGLHAAFSVRLHRKGREGGSPPALRGEPLPLHCWEDSLKKAQSLSVEAGEAS